MRSAQFTPRCVPSQCHPIPCGIVSSRLVSSRLICCAAPWLGTPWCYRYDADMVLLGRRLLWVHARSHPRDRPSRFRSAAAHRQATRAADEASRPALFTARAACKARLYRSCMPSHRASLLHLASCMAAFVARESGVAVGWSGCQGSRRSSSRARWDFAMSASDATSPARSPSRS